MAGDPIPALKILPIRALKSEMSKNYDNPDMLRWLGADLGLHFIIFNEAKRRTGKIFTALISLLLSVSRQKVRIILVRIASPVLRQKQIHWGGLNKDLSARSNSTSGLNAGRAKMANLCTEGRCMRIYNARLIGRAAVRTQKIKVNFYLPLDVYKSKYLFTFI